MNTTNTISGSTNSVNKVSVASGVTYSSSTGTGILSLIPPHLTPQQPVDYQQMVVGASFGTNNFSYYKLSRAQEEHNDYLERAAATNLLLRKGITRVSKEIANALGLTSNDLNEATVLLIIDQTKAINPEVKQNKKKLNI